MDIPRKSAAKKRRVRQIVYLGVAILVAGGITIGVTRLKPAAMSVAKSTVQTSRVVRGEFLREVRGNGTLVPEVVQVVPAQVAGRIVRKLVQPGTVVKPDTILIEMANPDLVQELKDAETKLRAEQSNLKSLSKQLEKQSLDEKVRVAEARTRVADLEAELKKLEMEARSLEDLGRQGLKAKIEVDKARITADSTKERVEAAKNTLQVEQERMSKSDEEIKARLDEKKEEIRQLDDAVKLKQQQVANLKVRAGIEGVLQIVSVEEGQQVTQGQNLARVADPTHLKAELKIEQSQVRDVQPGQAVTIDTRTGPNGKVEGAVSRIDPSVQNGTVTVDVKLPAELPRAARPDLAVDGVILIEKVSDVLYIDRPSVAQEGRRVGMFKLEPDGVSASLVQVELGRNSVRYVEVVSGLKEGDLVITSDTSQFASASRIQLQ